MGEISPVREVQASTCSGFALLIFMSFCFAVSTDTYKGRMRRIPHSLICTCKSSLSRGNTAQRGLGCRMKASMCSCIWFWKCAAMVYETGNVWSLAAETSLAAKPQTSFQLALIQFQNVSLGFSPPLRTIKEKANPFCLFQNILSNTRIWDNPIFIQPLPVVIHFLYKCIHDDTCFLWSRPNVVCREHFHSYSGWYLEVLRSRIYAHSHLYFGNSCMMTNEN